MINNFNFFIKTTNFSLGTLFFFWKFCCKWIKKNFYLNLTIFFLNFLMLAYFKSTKFFGRGEFFFFCFFFIAKFSKKKKKKKNVFLIFLYFILKNFCF